MGTDIKSIIRKSLSILVCIIFILNCNLVYMEEVKKEPDYNDYFDKGLKLKNESKYTEALEAFDVAAGIRPNKYMPHFYKAQIYMYNLLDFEKALSEYDKVIQIDPNNEIAYSEKCVLYSKLGDTENKIKTYEKLIEINPKNNNAFSNLIYIYINELKKPLSALSYCDKAIEQNPQIAENYIRKANILFSIYKLDMKNEIYNLNRKALEIQPQNIYYLSGTAFWAINLKKYDEAITYYKKYLEIEPQSTFAYTQITQTMVYQAKKYNEALPYIEKAMKLSPNDTLQYTLKGYALQGLKRYDDALNVYNEMIEKKLNPQKAYFESGLIYEKIGKFDKAVEITEKMLKINSKDDDAYFIKGKILYSQKKYQQAISMFDSAIKCDARNSDAFYFRSCCNALINNTNDSINDLKKSIEINNQLKESAKSNTDFKNLSKNNEFLKLIK